MATDDLPRRAVAFFWFMGGALVIVLFGTVITYVSEPEPEPIIVVLEPENGVLVCHEYRS